MTERNHCKLQLWTCIIVSCMDKYKCLSGIIWFQTVSWNLCCCWWRHQKGYCKTYIFLIKTPYLLGRLRTAWERCGTIFKATAFTIFNLLFSLECIFEQKPDNVPTARMIYCSCPDECHPQSATKAKVDVQRQAALHLLKTHRWAGEKLFWSSLSLVLLCFKGMKCLQSPQN